MARAAWPRWSWAWARWASAWPLRGSAASRDSSAITASSSRPARFSSRARSRAFSATAASLYRDGCNGAAVAWRRSGSGPPHHRRRGGVGQVLDRLRAGVDVQGPEVHVQRGRRALLVQPVEDAVAVEPLHL